LAAAPSTPQKGKPVIFTATVNGYAPTGTVVFKLDGVPLSGSAALVGGAASFNSGGLSVGAHVVSVDYSGDSQNEASSVSLPFNVFDPATLMPILEMLMDD
jgi:hypothetical protein